MIKLTISAFAILSCAMNIPAFAQQAPARDQFFWLGEINKATAVINTDEGLLERSVAPRLAAGISKVVAAGMVSPHCGLRVEC